MTNETQESKKPDQGGTGSGTDAGSKNDSGQGAAADQKVDYAGELAKERAARQQAESERETYKAALDQKRQLRKKGGESEAENDELDPGNIVDQVVERLAPVLSSGTLETELARLSDNPSKQELVKFHYENSIQRSGLDPASIRRDLQKALALADAPRITAERDEAARAAANADRGGSHIGGNTGNDRGDTRPEHGWTTEQVSSMKSTFKQATGKEMSEKDIVQAWQNYQKRKNQNA